MLEKIINYIKQSTGKDITSKQRTNNVVYLRSLYYHLAFENCKYYSLSVIGRKVNRDHATVLHGLKIWNNELHKDPYFINLKQDIVEALKLNSPKIDKLNELVIEISEYYEAKLIKDKAELKKPADMFHVLGTLPKDIQLDFYETRLKPYLKINKIKLF